MIERPAARESVGDDRALDLAERVWFAGVRQLVMGVLAVFFVLPLVWMLAAALRPLALPPPRQLEWWQPNPTAANFQAVATLIPLGQYILNSLIVVALAVPLTVLTASLAGFALAQLPPRARGPLVGLSVAMLLVPDMALWLGRFLVFRSLGLLDSLLALIAPAVFGSSPLYVLLLFWAFRRVPSELFDAARVDGCGAFRTWWSIALPVSRPALAAVAVLSFLYYWSSFIEPVLYIHRQDRYTLPVGLQALQQMHPSTWPVLMAGAVVVTLPAVALFLLAQRYVVDEQRSARWLDT